MSVTERRLIRETSFGLTSKLWQVSWIYVVLLCALASVGYVALYSAGGGAEPYASRHILRFAFGLTLMLSIAMVDIRFIARLSWPAYALGVLLLLLVAQMGHVGKGAQRWIEIAGMQWQPSEFMKLALVMALAAWFHRASWERMGNVLFLLPPALAVVAKGGTPRRSVAVLVAISLIFAASGSYESIVTIYAPWSIGPILIVCLAAIRLRYSEPDLYRPWKMPLFPWIAILAAVIQASLIAVVVWDDPKSGLWSAVVAFAPIPIYLAFAKTWREQAQRL